MVLDVSTEDVAAEGLSLELLALSVVSNETGHGVGDVQTTISSSLHGSENLASSAGLSETNIQETLEGASVTIDGGNVVVLSVDVVVSGVLGVHVELLQDTASNQQTSGIGSSIVGVANGETISGELMAIGGSKDEVSLDLGVDDLADGVLVGL